jgi:hypothetical protein
MIILQIIRIKATFSERTIRSNKAARQLKNFNGFDKEPHRLFDPDEIAKKNFLAQRLRNVENQEITDFSYSPEINESENSLDKLDDTKIKHIRMPRTIETIKINKSLDNLENIENSNRSNIQNPRNLYRKTEV